MLLMISSPTHLIGSVAPFQNPHRALLLRHDQPITQWARSVTADPAIAKPSNVTLLT